MTDGNSREPLLEMFLFETSQLLEQLEQSILESEKESYYTDDSINAIFRVMHTIKGSASMMLFDHIAKLAHSIEDLFYYIREEKPEQLDCSELSDLILEGVDFIKIEIEKIRNGSPPDGNAATLTDTMHTYLQTLKGEGNETVEQEPKPLSSTKQQYYISQLKQDKKDYQHSYKAVIRFEDGCEMENIRAYTIVHNLKGVTEAIHYIPDDIIDSDDSIQVIRRDGFQIYFKADQTYEQMNAFFLQTIFLKDLELVSLENDDQLQELTRSDQKDQGLLVQQGPIKVPILEEGNKGHPEAQLKTGHMDKESGTTNSTVQSIISVSVSKLDKLMDLVGEMVIAEAMVIQNPDLKNLQLNNFKKAARQLNKITGEIQDMVMSIRMVPLSATFTKMHRIVRDMSKKLGKEVHLDIIGEETEVDKNIIEHISDPLMHLVRNCVDHGIEKPEDRVAKGKPRAGVVTLEAKNAGSDVLIIVSDDGGGLNKNNILKKARENNLLYKNEEDMTDKEIYNLILLPGFSTKDKVTEFSGRGVGMDVVSKNIEAIGGSLSVDSTPGEGSVITLKIPLTLAIIDGMNIRVGKSRYTLPMIAIMESFRPKDDDIFMDPEGNEMIMVRGNCYQVHRLHEMYKVKTDVTRFSDGIIIMLAQDDKITCVFADELLGQQQVVVKALPQYIQKFKKNKGLAGCTLLGDGSISLILDVARIINA